MNRIDVAIWGKTNKDHKNPMGFDLSFHAADVTSSFVPLFVFSLDECIALGENPVVAFHGVLDQTGNHLPI